MEQGTKWERPLRILGKALFLSLGFYGMSQLLLTVLVMRGSVKETWILYTVGLCAMLTASMGANIATAGLHLKRGMCGLIFSVCFAGALTCLGALMVHKMQWGRGDGLVLGAILIGSMMPELKRKRKGKKRKKKHSL